MKKKQIVVFGGCFNPPLNSHFSLAEQILNEYTNIEKIVFVPVNSNYGKIGLLSNEHRYQMLKLVCDKNEKFEVSRIEIEEKRQLYTIETLRKIQRLYPTHKIAFIMGSDNLKELEKWERADELVEEFKMYILRRDKDNVEEIIQSSDFLKKNRDAFVEAKNSIVSNLSSSLVREKLKKGKSIQYLTPDEVMHYIMKNKLYQ